MSLTCSIKFADKKLNAKLVALLSGSAIKHGVDRDGIIRYSPIDEEAVENDFIGSIRDGVFPSWQLLSCPSAWVGRYREYMIRHDVPFAEELADRELRFLIPRGYHPHAWELDPPNDVEEASALSHHAAR